MPKYTWLTPSALTILIILSMLLMETPSSQAKSFQSPNNMVADFSPPLDAESFITMYIAAENEQR